MDSYISQSFNMQLPHREVSSGLTGVGECFSPFAWAVSSWLDFHSPIKRSVIFVVRPQYYELFASVKPDYLFQPCFAVPDLIGPFTSIFPVIRRKEKTFQLTSILRIKNQLLYFILFIYLLISFRRHYLYCVISRIVGSIVRQYRYRPADRWVRLWMGWDE